MSSKWRPTQQPAASDLRTVMSVVHLGVELERMGDYAEGIAKLCLRIYQEPLLKPLIDIPRMSDLALTMLNESRQAFAERDEFLARSERVGRFLAGADVSRRARLAPYPG